MGKKCLCENILMKWQNRYHNTMKKLFVLLFISCFLVAETKTIAISYFDNTSSKDEWNYISKGLADMLITDLSNVKSIQIVEREKLEQIIQEQNLALTGIIDESTAAQVGKLLGAKLILTGSFLIMGETMRIDARLVDVSTGEVIMAEKIEGKKDTFFQLEKDLVNNLVASLNLGLSKSEQRRIKKIQTESFEAFYVYSSAIVALDNEEYEESKKLLEKAVEIDDNYDIAWDKLDEIVANLDKLLALKELKLTEDIINIINDIEKNDKSSCEIFHKMFFLKWNNIHRAFSLINNNIYDLSPGRPGFTTNEELTDIHNRRTSLTRSIFITDDLIEIMMETHIYGKMDYRSPDEILTSNVFKKTNITIEEYVSEVEEMLNEFVSLLKYVDSKDFNTQLCENIGGMVENDGSTWYIQNPTKLIGIWFITGDWETFQNWIIGLLNLEYITGKSIEILDLDGEKKDAKTVLDELIIYFGNKYLKSFPYDVSDQKLQVINEAINRKKNPDIYNAYQWVNTYGILEEAHLLGKNWDFLDEWSEIVIYEYSRSDPIPNSFSLIPHITDVSFHECVPIKDLESIRKQFPEIKFNSAYMGKYYDGALPEIEYRVIDLVESRLLNKISIEQFQLEKNVIYKQEKKDYILRKKNKLLKIDSSEKRLKELNKLYERGFISKEEFEDLKKELGL